MTTQTGTLIKLSIHAKCAVASECYSAVMPKASRKEWIGQRDLHVDGDGRVFVMLGLPKHKAFMDAITGSLYKNGGCLTSDALKLRKPKRNQLRASQILMGMAGMRATPL